MRAHEVEGGGEHGAASAPGEARSSEGGHLPKRSRRSAALWVAVAAASAFVLEGTLRVRHFVLMGTFKRIPEYVIHEPTGLRIPPPHSRSLGTDSLGFRSPELANPKPSGTVRLAFLGSSTTFCSETRRVDRTWAHLVCEALRERLPGAHLDYVNASYPGYTLVQTLVNFRHRVAPLSPDVLVVYESPSALASDTREMAIAQGVYSDHGDRDSWLARYSLAWYLLEKNLLFYQRRLGARTAAEALTFEPSQLARGFHDRLLELVLEGQQQGKLVVLMTFAHRARRSQSREEQIAACGSALYFMPYMTPEGVMVAFEEYNRAIRAVAAESGAVLLETAEAVPGDEQYFRDSMHLTDEGCAVLARVVALGLLDRPEFRALFGR